MIYSIHTGDCHDSSRCYVHRNIRPGGHNRARQRWPIRKHDATAVHDLQVVCLCGRYGQQTATSHVVFDVDNVVSNSAAARKGGTQHADLKCEELGHGDTSRDGVLRHQKCGSREQNAYCPAVINAGRQRWTSGGLHRG